MKVVQSAAPKISGVTLTNPFKTSNGVFKWGRHKVRGKEALRSSVEFAPWSIARRAYSTNSLPQILRFQNVK